MTYMWRWMKKCALQLQLYMTLVSCFYSIMWITSFASSVRIAGSLAWLSLLANLVGYFSLASYFFHSSWVFFFCSILAVCCKVINIVFHEDLLLSSGIQIEKTSWHFGDFFFFFFQEFIGTLDHEIKLPKIMHPDFSPQLGAQECFTIHLIENGFGFFYHPDQ